MLVFINPSGEMCPLLYRSIEIQWAAVVQPLKTICYEASVFRAINIAYSSASKIMLAYKYQYKCLLQQPVL